MSRAFTVTGTEDIRKAIKKLDSKKARATLRRALGQAAQPVVSDARRLADQNVGKRTGQSRKQIKKTTSKRQIERLLGRKKVPFKFSDNFGEALIAMVYLEEGAKGKPAFYLRFWETGFTRNGIHYAAKPWLRPAFDNNEANIINRYKSRAKILIEREVAKRK